MTLYGIGLGPGAADLLTLRGKRILERADVVYSPGRLARSIVTEHVPADRISDLEFPMTCDPEELRSAWKEAAAEIAPRARDGDAAFVTIGDPNVYSTFGHLRRTMAAFHPDVDVETVPGVSMATAFATPLGVEIDTGAGLTLREAPDGEAPLVSDGVAPTVSNGEAPTVSNGEAPIGSDREAPTASDGTTPAGPDRLILFKVTDAPATHEKLVEAGYDVRFGRRLFMQQGETIVTDDPADVADRDYYTVAYAQRSDLELNRPTEAFCEEENDRTN